MTADLKGADLAGKDLSGSDLRGANLEGASLRKAKLSPGTLLSNANLTKADLYQADLRGANLQEVNFNETNLFEATLREADLQGADLSAAQGGLQTEQLAGANLTGTNLPNELKRLYDQLENVKGISESTRKLFLAVLAACLYCWLTIATTTDVNLITNRNSSPLPIIQTSIPIVSFYFVAPLLVLCVYFYFHFYLQKLWEELGSLPAVFPDGRPLHTKVDPWLLNDLVRAHLPKLNVNRPFLSYLQLWISVLLAWWVVPITMFLFWVRYMRRHEAIGTTFHVVSLVVSLVAAVCLYRLAIATLRGTERMPFTWKKALTSRRGYRVAALACTAGLLFALLSLGAVRGVRSRKPILGLKSSSELNFGEAKGPRTWVPRLMALIGDPPFANLAAAEVSQKKSAWGMEKDKNSDSVTGAELSGVDLRYAAAERAFLVGADLRGTDLRGAYLYYADLTRADLSEANLTGARLTRANLSEAFLHLAHLNGAEMSEADLTRANLSRAELRGASLYHSDLSGADLTHADLKGAILIEAEMLYCDFRGARNLDPTDVTGGISWERAFYDDGMLKALGLPPDHNEKLDEQRKKEQLQQAQSEGEALPNSSLPKQ